MISGRVVALALVTTALQGNSAQDLRVLRHSPDREGSSTPDTLLPSDREYTVTVRDTWATEAGDRLPEPYRFGFRVAGPRVLTRSIAGAGEAADYLDPRARIALLVSGPGDYSALARATYLELATSCGGDRVVRFTLGGDRDVATTDPWEFRRWSFDEGAEERRDLRRVVTLAPERPLSRDCPAVLVAPHQIGARVAAPPHRWAFRTYGPLRLVYVRWATAT
jgi:hypothetical protein